MVAYIHRNPRPDSGSKPPPPPAPPPAMTYGQLSLQSRREVEALALSNDVYKCYLSKCADALETASTEAQLRLAQEVRQLIR